MTRVRPDLPCLCGYVRRGAGCGIRLAGACRRARQLRLRRPAEASLGRGMPRLSRPSIRTRATSEATSTWRGTASARASTATSNIRFPDLLGGLRTALYPHLAAVANEWNGRMGIDERYPGDHASFLKQCHDAGQTRPTPLLLQYVPGDFNCLHQDLYGDLAFPIQVAILLSEPGEDFTGGEFVLTEQRPRMQSRAEVVPLRQGDAVAFAVHNRPVQGSKGNYRVNLRHGVSRVRSGMRHTVGIIFHDAA